MAEFNGIVGTITINKNILSVDNQHVAGMFSANLIFNVNFVDDFWNGFEVLEWYAANSYVEKTEVCVYDSMKKTLTIPYGNFTKDGNLYISVRGIKGNVKYASNILTLIVDQNINIEDNDVVEDPSWLDKVSQIIDEVFIQKYDPQYEALEKEVTDVKDKVDEQQAQIDSSIAQMGEYEWDGTRIRFKIRDGVWGEWKDIAGEFAKQEDMTKVLNSYQSVTDLTKQMYLLMHNVGDIITTTDLTNPGTIYGGTWERVKNKPTILVLIGSEVKTFGEVTDSVIVHSFKEIQEMFNTEYGVKPSSKEEIGVSFVNGDGSANSTHLDSATWENDNLYTTLNRSQNNPIRVNYQYTYKYTDDTIYQWKRTA